ncbi:MULTISPECIES: NAD-dependent epimerase/dehydratase family protein [Streptomyces]|uniref:NAD-dependent epimerase/dehydratase family protein n=1 Tax=Streptomyces odorifer TaxID=53450 RepID=A0A7Y6CAS0_9ACTN|nr:NAD-dependent epimerase/dehydratase family protein [Streptomyces odorifer]NUV30169.1 NAD-dependent epimerase/dehydratase family protein [Streptomyces odorifer]NUV34489.1 NAD-dependent epimerase/dehydratase family protein [Streptomyces sp. KAI-27]NUV51106.1 NAD-dependent epimerase/dehydratase family protein [Streptomyces sp. CAI-78]
MHTVLGANGPIGEELARELFRGFTHDIRLVSRSPRKIHDTDQLVTADLTDPEATDRAVEGSEVAYLTVGLPMDSGLWERQFPAMMRNVIDACAKYGTKLVFFDNTYMYPGTTTPQTESTGFAPNGRKGRVRAEIARMLLDAMSAGRVEAVVCRAPEFYGPGKTKSLTNSLVFDRIKAGRRPLVPVSAQTLRSLIWTPDASRAMALIGNTPDAYGQTWHLPIGQHRLTYAGLVQVAEEVTGRRIRYTVLPLAFFPLGGRFVGTLGEVQELLPRYRGDNIFDTAKFATRFPDFTVTSYREGITEILR